MKIGILTFHRAHNYGAVLQCYALEETLRSLGHEVYVIDYRQPEIEAEYMFHRSISYHKLITCNLISAFRYLCSCVYNDVRSYRVIKEKVIIFDSFQQKYLNIDSRSKKSVPLDYDVYIIGSDMLWANDCMKGKFDKIYLGQFKRNNKSTVLGYAISGTPASFDLLAEQTNFQFLSNFKAISIREKVLKDIIDSHVGGNIKQCIDPTLLTTKDLWSNIVNKKWSNKKYIVTYFIRKRNKYIVDSANQLAERHGFEIVDIDVSRYAHPITVEDFVSLIAYAQYVVTDSFHGIVFSMIFERPFQALKLNDAHDARYVDVLKRLGLSKLTITVDSVLKIPAIDYNAVNNEIKEFRQSSLNFLKNNL